MQIMVKDSGRKEYACDVQKTERNTSETSGDSQQQTTEVQENRTVVQQSGTGALLLAETMPEISGVLIVASGAGQASVQEQLLLQPPRCCSSPVRKLRFCRGKEALAVQEFIRGVRILIVAVCLALFAVGILWNLCYSALPEPDTDQTAAGDIEAVAQAENWEQQYTAEQMEKTAQSAVLSATESDSPAAGTGGCRGTAGRFAYRAGAELAAAAKRAAAAAV